MMFHTSSQKKHWIFASSQNISKLRRDANAKYCQKHNDTAAKNGCQFVSPLEEVMMCQYYMKKLFEFCDQFQPPVPRSVLGTAAAYYKRFYLNCSVMEHHPTDVFLCIVYLAFKVEEYNVSIDQFVYVLTPEMREQVAELVLGSELLLLKKLKFHLTIHSPFRPLEGFVIDLLTQCPNIERSDALKRKAEDFLLKSLYSDAALLYPPSQIALTALWHSSKAVEVEIKGYIKSVAKNDALFTKLLSTLQDIEDLVLAVMIPESSMEIAHIKKKIEVWKNVERIQSNRKRKSEEQLGEPTGKKIRPQTGEDVIFGIDKL